MTDSTERIRLVRVLGAVQIETQAGRVVDLPSATQRRTLALLALNARRALRSEWMSSTLEVEPSSLRTTVSRLRKTLGNEVLVSTSVGYRLMADVDASRFSSQIAEAGVGNARTTNLENALALWRGPALEEFSHENWAVGDVARLTELHASTVEDVAEALIRERRWGEAVARLESHVTTYRFRDRPRGLLIHALAGAGRQSDALRAFHDYRSLLADEVGTAPSDDVEAIERLVASGWNGVDRVPGDEKPRAARTAGTDGVPQVRAGTDRRNSAAPQVSDASKLQKSTTAFDSTVWSVPLHGALQSGPVLVGRSQEYSLLDRDLADAVKSGMRTVILGGEAGIGKSTLLGAFARDIVAAGRANVLYGRCDEGSAVPLQPFRSVITWLLEHLPQDVLRGHRDRFGAQLGHLAATVGMGTASNEVGRVDSATQQYLLFEAASDLLRRAAAVRPLVVMLDDLHWAEPTALLLLRHLGRSLLDAPVLLVVSYRNPGEVRPDELRSALADLDRGRTRRVPLSGFETTELQTLATSLFDERVPADLGLVVDALLRETAGNPLYASQLLRHWIETGRVDSDGTVVAIGSPRFTTIPPNLRDVVWSRVASLGADSASVLKAAAVFGAEFREDILCDMLDLSEAEIGMALDSGLSAGLLVETDSSVRTLRFAHNLVANALYAELHGLERRRLHQMAARALEKNSVSLPQKVVVQLAHHAGLAGQLDEAQRWATMAGEHALAHLAPAEAARWLVIALGHARALERPEEVEADLLVRIGEAQQRAGDARALETLFEGAVMATRCGAHSALIRAALALDRGTARGGDLGPKHRTVVESAIAIADRDDISTYVQLLAVYGQCLVFTSHADLRRQVAHEALALVETSPDPTLLPRIASSLLAALWGPGTSELRGRIAARAVAAADASGDPFLAFRTHHAAYGVAVETADPVTMTTSLNRMRSIAAVTSEPRMRWLLLHAETFVAMMEARFADAERLAMEAFTLGTQVGETDAFTVFAAQSFVLATFAGKHADLVPLMEQMMNDNAAVLAFRQAYAIVCEAVGRVEVAREVLAEGLDTDLAEVEPNLVWMTSVIGYAVLAIELNDIDAAAKLFPIIEPFAREVSFNGNTSQGPISAYVGKLGSLLGFHDLAEAQLQDALTTATAFGWVYHQATSLLALAQARIRRLGRSDADCVRWLDESEAICRAKGIANWLRDIEELRTTLAG